MKRVPEVVVFDLGKVLVDFDFSIAAQKIAAHSTKLLDEAQVKELVSQSPLLVRFESGQITSEDFFTEICRLTGFSGYMAEFACFFADIFTPIDSMIGVHAALRARGVPVYIFSNTNDLAVSHIRMAFPFFAEFDGYIYSYQHGAMKPQPKMYEALEQMAGRKGDQILYLDDRLENVAAGQARGWQTIHHQQPEETISRFHELGLLS